jgi:hypothetical protein
VRNVALPFVETEWMAFLDDDTLKLTYVEKLKQYIKSEHNHIDIVHFTIERDGGFEPEWGQLGRSYWGGGDTVVLNYPIKFV